MLKRVSWMFAGTMLGNGTRFLFSMLLARHVGIAEFGRFSICTLLALSAYTILGIGIGDTSTRYVATGVARRSRTEVARTLKLVSWLAVVAGVFGWLFFWFGADYIASSWFDKPEIGSYLQSLAWSIPAGVFFLVASGTVQAFEAFRLLNAIRNVGLPALPLVLWLMLRILRHDGGIGSAIAAWNIALVISAMAAVLAAWYLYRTYEWSSEQHEPPVRAMLGFAGAAALIGLVNVLQSWLETFLLGRLGAARDVGEYGAATRLVQPLAFATSSFISVYMPRAVALHTQNDHAELKALYQRTTRLTAITMAVPFVGLLAFGAVGLQFFGGEFKTAWTALAIYATAQMVIGITGPASQQLLMTGHQSHVLLSMTCGLVASFVTGMLAIPHLGAAGAGCAFLASMTSYSVVAMIQVRRIHGYWPWQAPTARVAGVAVVAGIVGALLHDHGLVFTIGSGSILVVISIVAVYAIGLEPEERNRVLETLRLRPRTVSDSLRSR